MPTVTITTPANSGHPLPATIMGSYDLAAVVIDPPTKATAPPGLTGTPYITVLISSPANNYFSGILPTTVTMATGTTGSWTCARPAGLNAGNDYLIIATLRYYSGTDTDIKHSLTHT